MTPAHQSMLYLFLCLLILVPAIIYAVTTYAEKNHLSTIEALAGILKPRDGTDD